MQMLLAARLAGWGECSAQHVTLDAAKCSTEAVSIGVYFHMSVFLLCFTIVLHVRHVR